MNSVLYNTSLSSSNMKTGLAVYTLTNALILSNLVTPPNIPQVTVLSPTSYSNTNVYASSTTIVNYGLKVSYKESKLGKIASVSFANTSSKIANKTFYDNLS